MHLTKETNIKKNELCQVSSHKEQTISWHKNH